MTRKIKAGTRIEVGLAGGRIEQAVIMPWRKVNGDPAKIPGYHPVRFIEDGARLMVHEDMFRVLA